MSLSAGLDFTALATWRVPMIRQASASECGLACIAMIARASGRETDLIALRRRHGTTQRGNDLKQLISICNSEGLSSRALRCSVDELRFVAKPAILHWGFDHFVVLCRWTRGRAVIHDPARGVIKVDNQELRDQFTGVALEITAEKDDRDPPSLPRLSVRDLLAKDKLPISAIVVALILAVVCEVLVLVSPLYLQVVIDGVVSGRDVALLQSLLLAFAVVLLFQVIATAVRGLTFLFLGQQLAFDMASRLLTRLANLAPRYFRSRDLGDIQHRFQSAGIVQSFLTTTMPRVVLDTLFIVLVVVLLWRYSPALTLLNLGGVTVWALWRVASFPRRRRLQADLARADANSQSHFLESVRAMLTIKAAGGEQRRVAEWRSLLAHAINHRVRIGYLQATDNAVRQTALQGARLMTIFFLAQGALAGTYTVGMVAAFATWQGMLTARATGLVNALLEQRLLRVPLDRLADIVFADADCVATPLDNARSERATAITLQDVSVRFGSHEPLILNACNASFRAGSFVAIAGGSGAGKSTLLRVLAGLEETCTGQVLFDGHLRDVAFRRRQSATLLQDQTLLKGSLADNIALFDDEVTLATIKKAARQACIHDYIQAMPMGYLTRISDLGSGLSYGQVQRILLARAICRGSPLMLLDEPTSGLDPVLEKRVARSLREIDATRIVVTHSDQILSAADQVLWLRDGSLLSSAPALSVRGE